MARPGSVVRRALRCTRLSSADRVARRSSGRASRFNEINRPRRRERRASKSPSRRAADPARIPALRSRSLASFAIGSLSERMVSIRSRPPARYCPERTISGGESRAPRSVMAARLPSPAATRKSRFACATRRRATNLDEGLGKTIVVGPPRARADLAEGIEVPNGLCHRWSRRWAS